MNRVLLALFFGTLAFAQTDVRRTGLIPSYKDLKYPPLPPIKPPEPMEFTLSNGIKVFLLENHELPEVSGAALIRTGNLFDPSGKHGLAQMTGEVLRSGGTKAKTGDQLDEELENVAASVESGISEGAGSISFSCLKENTDQVLRVFAEIMTSAEFRADKVDLSKTQMRSAISRRNDDANGIAEREFASILYGRNTPYGWEIEYSDVDNIQRQDMLDFYHRYYFPANVMLEVYGDFNSAEMKTKLEQILGSWKYAQPPVPPFPKVQAVAAPGVYVAAKTDVTQTFFNVGHLGGELRDKDYPALEVAAQILGGGFSSRLFQTVRTKHGWAYNIGAGWGADYEHPGAFKISGSTQSAHTVDTLKAVRDELDRIRTTEVTDAELKTAKDTVLNGFVFHFDRPSKTLNRLLEYEYHGYPRDFLFQYQKAIAAVTKADIFRVAKEHLRPQDLTFVAVGNPAEFGTPLTALGLKVETIDLTIPEPKKETAQADPASLQKGKQVLQKVQQFLGGADKIAAIKDIQYHAQVDVETPGAVMKAKQTNSYVVPLIMRQDIELPIGKQSVYSDGQAGWIVGMQGTMALPPPVAKQMRGESFRQILLLALSDRDPNRTVNYAGPGKLDISSKDGDSATLEVDEKTGAPLKLNYTEGQAITQVFSDWREVSGFHLPYKWIVLQGERKFATATIEDYKINSGLTPEALSKKP
jgi:zinc protease